MAKANSKAASAARTATKSRSNKAASQPRSIPKRIEELATALDMGATPSRAQEAALNAWARKHVPNKIRVAMMSGMLAFSGHKRPGAQPTQPEPTQPEVLPLKQQRAILACRLEAIDAIRLDVQDDNELAKAAFKSVAEMAEQLSEEQDRDRQYAFVAALRALAAHGEGLMSKTLEALDDAPARATVDADDIKELETADAEGGAS